MLIYWIIFILTLIGAVQDRGKNKNNVYFYFLLSCLVAICALRHISVGTDTPLYTGTITSIVHNNKIYLDDLEYYGQGRDPIFWYVYGTVYLLSGSILGVFFFHGIVHWALIGITLKKNTSFVCLALAVMIAFRFSDFYLNAMRQGISVALILFSFLYIKNRKLIYYLCVLSIAVLFHGSSLLFLPMYWVYNISFEKLSKKKIVFLLLMAIAFSSLIYKYVLINLFQDSYAIYLNEQKSHGVLYFALYLVSFVLCVLNVNLKDKETRFLLIVCLIAVILQAATFSNPIFTRISAIYSIYFSLLIPRVTSNVCDKYKSNTPQYLVVAMLLLLYIVGGPAPGVVPYKFFWE